MTERSSGGGPGLAAAGLPRLVSVPSCGATYHVRPPTVREAVEILTALPSAIMGDDEDADVVLDVLSGWLPGEVLDQIMTLGPVTQARAITDLVNQGAGAAASGERKNSAGTDGEKEAARKETPEYALAIADYVAVFGGEAWAVYNGTPWPFFLRCLECVESAYARQLIRWAEVETLPHAGKAAKSILERLQARARGEAAPEDRPRYASKEEIAKDREELKELWTGRNG